MERTTLTVADVAQMLGISPDTVSSMVREKKIPHLRYGNEFLNVESSFWMGGAVRN